MTQTQDRIYLALGFYCDCVTRETFSLPVNRWLQSHALSLFGTFTCKIDGYITFHVSKNCSSSGSFPKPQFLVALSPSCLPAAVPL